MWSLLVTLACAPPAEEVPSSPNIATLVVVPDAITVVTGPEGGEPVRFVAEGSFDDGKTGRLDTVSWSVSNRGAGEIASDGIFTPSTENGGVTWVTARFDGAEAQAVVTVVYEDVRNDAGIDTTAFDAEAQPISGLWTYPSDGVNLPRNTPSITFQWSAAGASAARLRFRSQVTDLTVYTTESSWTADEATWAQVAGTNAGGAVDVELSVVIDGVLYAEALLTLHVNRFDATGSIYYWSSSASGFKRIPYGGQAEDFLTQASDGYCVGCHVIHDDLVAFTYDGGNGNLGVKHVSDKSDVLPYGSGVYGNFKAWSPDGRYLLTTYAGALLLYDGGTLEYLGEVSTDGYTVSHVDWSPDGLRIVLVLTESPWSDWGFLSGRIAVMDVVGDGQFGSPIVFYDPPDGYTAYYPAWSPDGEWIAFNLSTGDSYDDIDAMLYVMPGDGGAPILLSAANAGDHFTNSYPRWGPLPDDDVLWLAFSSKRTYGNLATGVPQIWLAAFDPELARAGADPSYAAFWLPGQDVTQNNHIPVWAK